jgi:hypothetical protein
MKNKSLLLVLFMLVVRVLVFSQDSTNVAKHDRNILYTVGYNRVPEGFNFPLIGFINVAQGNHTGLQIGFSNRNSKDFNGLEIAFANIVGSELTGAQIAFFNAVGKNSNGLTVGFFNAVGNAGNGCQIGFANAIGNKFNGLNLGIFNAMGNSFNGTQVGLLNVIGNKMQGIQVGFANVLGNKADGFQVGFVNVIGNKAQGLQLGFVNLLGNKMEGVQIGFLNKIHQLSGFQLGFVNLIDTVSKGVSVGFFSLVKKNGYQAIEFGVSDMFPFSLSYKSGTKRFYTSLNASYGLDANNPDAFGLGMGTIVPVCNHLGFNPEVIFQSTFFHSWNQIYSLQLNALYALSDKFSIVAGPSLGLNHLNNNVDFQQPLFTLYQNKLDENNKLMVGLKAALRYQF